MDNLSRFMMLGRGRCLGLMVVVAILLVCTGQLHAEPAGCTTLRNVVPQCDCEASVEDASLPTLNCRNKNLNAVPTITGTYSGLIRHMALTNNLITSIPSNAFQGLRVFHLDITNNKVASVSDTAFVGLEGSLEELQLGGDKASPMQAPWTAVKVLTRLTRLEVDNFRVAGNVLSGSDVLTAFPNLTQLKVDSFNLTAVHFDFVLPRESTLKTVVFNNNNFATLPLPAMQHFLEVETLHITQANIVEVTDYGFAAMTKLKELDLSGNLISKLDPNCFNGVTGVLETLNLERNALNNTGQLDSISSLTALRTLRLGINLLTDLPASPAFLNNKSGLQTLHLNSNSLKTVPNGVFSAVQNQLQELNLGFNQISSIASNAFQNLGALQILNLENQTTATALVLPDLSSLTSLRELILSNMKFDSSNWQRIGMLSSMTTLVLSRASITSVPDFAIGQLTRLQELHLDGNDLSSLGQEALFGPRHTLSKLILSDNRLAGLSRCLLSDFSTNVTLSLLNNPLHCNCTLRWLLRSMQNGSVTLDTGLETCNTPSNLAGQFLTNLSPDNLLCDDNGLEPIPPCQDLYTTTTTPASTTTPPSTTPALPTTTITVSITGVNRESMTVNWEVADITYISYFYVEHTELSSGSKSTSSRLPQGARFFNIVNLSPGQNYQVCVLAGKTNNALQTECTTARTASLPTTTQSPDLQSQQGNDTPLIIALAVIGALVLILLVIVLFLFFFRRKKSQKDPSPPEPVQPRVFTRSELPTMGYDSKRFQRPKKRNTENNNVQPEAIQVNVISDGKNAGPSNLTRVSAGSYQALDSNARVEGLPSKPPRHTYVNDRGAYANDSDFRPLPRVPRDYSAQGQWGQVNPGFRQSDPRDDQRPPSYQEIVL